LADGTILIVANSPLFSYASGDTSFTGMLSLKSVTSVTGQTNSMDVRHLATSLHGDFVAAGAFETEVEIWGLKNLGVIARFGTRLNFGGKRLSIDRDGKVVLAGNYHTGVSCYSVPDGCELWYRKDLRRVQQCTVLPSNDRAVVAIEGKPAQIVRVSDGDTVDVIANAKRVFAFEDGVFAIESAKHLRVCRDQDSWLVRKETFGVLCASHIGESLAVGYSAGPLQRLDPETGKVHWSHRVAERHVLRISPSIHNGLLYGIDWNYSQGSKHALKSWDWETGRTRTIKLLNGTEFEFAKNGELLVCGNRRIIRCADGTVVRSVATD
jgi:hypothetical protein